MAIEKEGVEQRKQSTHQSGWGKHTADLLRQIHAQPTLESALQTLVEQISVTLQANRCFMLEFDEANQPLPIRIEARSSETVLSFTGLTPYWNYCPYLKQTAEHHIAWSCDAFQDEQITVDDILLEVVQTYNIHGVIACPIVHNDHLLCVLVVQTEEPRKWNEGELLFVQACSAQASKYIFQTQAAQLYERIHDSECRYQTLYAWERKAREVLQSIRESIDTAQVFPKAIEATAKALNADRAFLIQFDEEGQVLPIRHEALKDETVQSFTGLTPPWQFCPYLAQCAQHEMTWSADAFTDPTVVKSEQWQAFARQYSIHGIVALPIVYKDKLMNVMVFHTTEPRAWNEPELFFIQVISDHLSALFYQEKIREELVRTAELKSDFLSKMSHELRTPLNAIIGYAKMVEKEMVGPLNDKQLEYMQYVSNSGEHLLNLVSDVLDFSKIEAGKMTINPEPVNLYQLISEVRPMVKEQARLRQVGLSFQIQSDLEPIEADPSRLKQILLNLISNAIKFNYPGGTVSVRLNLEYYGEHEWLIGEVQDTGIGIPRHKIPELFNRFHQIDNSAARRHEGSGLGLVLTQEFVALHGGKILVDSEEGCGSTFTFKLPVRHPLSALKASP